MGEETRGAAAIGDGDKLTWALARPEEESRGLTEDRNAGAVLFEGATACLLAGAGVGPGVHVPHGACPGPRSKARSAERRSG